MDALKTRIDLVSLDNRFAAGCSAAGVSFHALRALVPPGYPVIINSRSGAANRRRSQPRRKALRPGFSIPQCSTAKIPRFRTRPR